MRTTVQTLTTALHEQYNQVLAIRDGSEPLEGYLKEMWITAEKLEAEAQNFLTKTQGIAKLLRSYVDECESGLTQSRPRTPQDAEDAHRPFTRTPYLPDHDPAAQLFQHLKGAIGSLSSSRAA
jgi:hypothetical protein